MPDMQHLADSMLSAAATVLGRLVEQPAAATGATRHDHDGSIRTDGAELVTLAELPSAGIEIVVRFASADMHKIVAAMLGGADDVGEMGAMQLSIASETASQIAVAMVEQLARELGVSPDGVKAELRVDATGLPPPPFESYDGQVQVGAELMPTIAVDFAAIALSRLAAAGSVVQPVEAPPPAEPAVQATPAPPPPTPVSTVPPQNAQNVAYASMQPSAPRTASPGQANLDLVHDVPLQIRAVLGRTTMPLREVVSLQSGSVFELDKAAAEPIDLYVNNILIARGEVVVVDDKYAVKISELNPQTE
ncbi:MAG: flagellar motor switch protein FliN [Vulcanimicrobiaceae bacterium]